MAKTVTFTLDAVGSSAWWPTDIHRDPFNIGFGVSITGDPTYTVEHTFVDTLFTDPVVAAGEIFPHSDVAAATANADGNYAFPVTGVRLTITNIATSGSVTGRFTQAGIRGG